MQHLVEASIVSPLLSPYQYSQPAAVAIAWAVAAALLADATNPGAPRETAPPPTHFVDVPPLPPLYGFFHNGRCALLPWPDTAAYYPSISGADPPCVCDPQRTGPRCNAGEKGSN